MGLTRLKLVSEWTLWPAGAGGRHLREPSAGVGGRGGSAAPPPGLPVAGATPGLGGKGGGHPLRERWPSRRPAGRRCAGAARGPPNGATVVALTSPDSPLTKVSSISLEVNVPENTDEYMAMTSRIVHLVILDVLATGFTLRRGPDFLPHLEKIKSSLKPTRYEKL